jgi:type II secretory pathway pseudopilin PulG
MQKRSAARRQRDGGYLLLAILLMMALMVVALTIAAPAVVQQLKRDREEEMIHRGTEYARAIKKYYKKFGRYPANLEQLDNTNQIRFLRKRYKDPLAKDGKWKLLNYGDIQGLLNNAPGTPAAALGAQAQGQLGQSALQQSIPVNPGPGGLTPGGVFGQSGQVIDPSQQQAQQPGGTAGGIAGSGPQAGQQQGNNPFQSTFSLGASPNQPGGNALGQSSGSGGGQTFGGGAIVGVASVSKDPTIRIYNKKKTYNEWQFIYNPIMDQANVLLRGPYQPTTLGGAQVGTPAGQMNQQQGGFGQQPNSFGPQSSGFGQQQQNVTPQRGPGTQFPPDQNQPQ